MQTWSISQARARARARTHARTHTQSRSRSIAFADDLIILTRGETVTEAENFMNLALTKVQNWAQNNRLVFNEDKSKAMIMTRRKRKGKKEIAVYINNKKT